MIVLSTVTADVNGVLILDIDESKSNLRAASRRVSRAKTLDGGVVIVDSGFAHGDRTPVIIVKNVSRAQADTITAFHQNNSIINLSMDDGFYSAVIRT